MGKTFVCRCEDVTTVDLEKAFAEGYRDMESLKRYTGFATGFCQGKCCTVHAARFLASMKGGDDVVVDPPRTRPLLHPTPAAAFAGAAGDIAHAAPDSESEDPPDGDQGERQ
jgi:bacterioferritin-associated ferredoxin